MAHDISLGWGRVAVGAIADIIAGQSPPGSTYNVIGEGLPFYQGKAEFGDLHPSPVKWCTAPKKVAEPGDILISVRAPVGPTNVADAKCAIGRGLAAIRPKGGISTSYLLHALRASVTELQARSTGTTFAAVSAKQLSEHEIVLAPHEVQDQIVEGIERRLTLLGAGVATVASATHRLASYKQAIFDRSFHPQPIPTSWKEAALGELALVGGGATPLRTRADYWGEGSIPWVTSGQLNDDLITTPSSWVTPLAVRECRLRLWPIHTLLIAMYGEGRTRGKCSELLIEATTNQACAAIILRKDAPLRHRFLKLFLQARYQAHRRIAAGGVQPNLSLDIVRNLKIPVPPLAVQDQLLEEMEHQLSVADQLTESLRHVVRRAKAMRWAVLQDAFAWPGVRNR